jgi:hypothetical protein
MAISIDGLDPTILLTIREREYQVVLQEEMGARQARYTLSLHRLDLT